MRGEQIEKPRLGADRVDAVDQEDGSPAAAAQHLEIEWPGPQPIYAAHQPNNWQAPLRPSGGRGRGPARSAGRVRWVSAGALESAPSPQPSPPVGERGYGFSLT